MFKNRPRPIAGLPDGVKVGFSLIASPIFSLLHYIDDRQDFKEFWTKGLSKKDTFGYAAFAQGVTAAWVSFVICIANVKDLNSAQKELHAKIDTVVAEESCSIPEGKNSVVCGVRDISPTPYSYPWLPFSGEGIEGHRVAVIAKKNIRGFFNEQGFPAREVCVSKGYLTDLTGEDISNSSQYRVVSTACEVVEPK